MAPVHGVVVLARQIDGATASASPGPYEVRGTMTLVGAGGHILKTMHLPPAVAHTHPSAGIGARLSPTPLASGGATRSGDSLTVGGAVAAGTSSNQGSASGAPISGSTTACADAVPPTASTP